MSDLILLPKSSNEYIYRKQPQLAGRLLGTLVFRHVYERLKVAEEYVRIRSPGARLIVLDSVRSVTLQAELFLQAAGAVASSQNPGIYRNARDVRRMARNPAVDVDAEHVIGAAVDVVLADPRTGEPYPEDVARYDSWGRAMKPEAFVDLAYAHMDQTIGRRYAAIAMRETMVREACKFAGFVPSEDEYCQFSAPDSHHDPFEAVDLGDYLVEKVSLAHEASLLERCRELHDTCGRGASLP